MALKLAILEFVCGGGLSDVPLTEIPSSLRREGQAMLVHLLNDCAGVESWTVKTTWDERFGTVPLKDVDIQLIQSGESWFETWLSLAESADLTLVIAPEIDGQLGRIANELRQHGCRVLLSDEAFLNVCSDKWLTAQSFQNNAVPHPPTWRLDDWISLASPESLHEENRSWVIKPRDGAGCHEIIRIDEAKEEGWRAIEDWNRPSEFIVQPWLSGQAGSVAVLCGPKQRIVLPPVTQKLDVHERPFGWSLEYLGGNGPWDPVPLAIIERFANQVLDAMPGKPLGWIGIDFLCLEKGEARDLVAIEVNPRLTTSYLGLRQGLDRNLGEMLIRIGRGEPMTSQFETQAFEFG
jgi:tyramine---L-glutamate ligase